MNEHEYVVSVDERGVRCTVPDGTVESVTWEDLRAVVVETNDTGPFGADVIMLLVGSESGCLVPQGATGDRELVDALLKLPGFDHELFISAMSCAQNEKFLCWERSESEPASGMSPHPVTTEEQAISVAKRVAEENGWPWEEPVWAHRHRAWIFFGRASWHVMSNTNARGRNVNVWIDERTGQVERAAFAKR